MAFTLPKAVLLLALLFLCRISSADRLHLHDGRVLEGIVEHADGDSVDLESTGGRVGIPRAGVSRIEIQPEASNALYRAAFVLHRHQPLAAAQVFRRGLELGAPRGDARAWCVERQRILVGVLGDKGGSGGAWLDIVRDLASDFPLTTTATLAADDMPSSVSLAAERGAVRLAETAGFSAGGDALSTLTLTGAFETEADRNYLVTMARVLDDAGRRLEAGEMIERLDPPAFQRVAMGEGFVQSLMIERVKGYLNTLDFAAAAALIERCDRGGMVVGAAARTLFLIRWSSFERRRGNYDAALRVLQARLYRQSPALARDGMRAVLTQARVELARARRYSEATALLAAWGDAALGAEARGVEADLYREWGEWLLETDKPDAARDAFAHYAALDANADPSALFAQCDFRERLLRIDPRDHAGAFELAQWAEREGLVSQAIEAYERAAENEQLRPLANEQIELLRDRVVLAHLKHCTTLFEAGDPVQALREMHKFDFLPVTRRLEPEIAKLRMLCLQEIARREGLKPVQAETIFQESQRRYYSGDTEAAMAGFRQVLEFFGDTPAAERTREFLRFNEMRGRMNELEGARQAPSAAGDIPEPSTGLEREVSRLLKELEIYPKEAPGAPPPSGKTSEKENVRQ